MTIQEALKKYFGYDSFRGGQQELVSAILDGQDVLGIMPTGAGKSICFQLPAVLHRGITLVVSPLISLMKDQVGALIQSGIPAAYINSTLSARQMERALENARRGDYRLIYVAPERLLAPDFLTFAKSVDIAMLTVDEAHCISQWGQDFRPSYAQIPQFIDRLEKRPIVSAFTATATARVREDILSLLSLQDPRVLVTGFDRQNLYFEVQAPRHKMQALTEFLQKHQNQSGIVYCATRKTVEEVCEELNRQGFSAARYHAGVPDHERHANQDDFLFDRVQIMVATNAFGMGIDKSNVSFVVHYNMPKDIESYYQEAGRAGRDGSAATCLLLYSGQDVRTNQWLIEHSRDVRDAENADEETERQLKERDYRRLREMTFYATTNDCLRAYILRYFGENPPGYCGHCGNCDTRFETVEVTQDAQKILSCVARMKERFGASLVIDVLRGSKNERIRELGLDALSTYGISDKSVHTLRAIIDFLVQGGYLEKSDGQYAVLRLAPQAGQVLNGTVKLEMKLAKEKVQSSPDGRSRAKDAVSAGREELYARLKAVRHDIAAEQGVPSFMVFSDSTLADMCARLPKTDSQFLTVSGVGETKLRRYGEQFLREITGFCRENAETDALDDSNSGQKRSRKSAEIILPDAALLKQIEISENPVTVSAIAGAVNPVLRQQGCSAAPAIRMADWLVSQGYLQIVEQEGSNTKEPTEKGLAFGIVQEERTSRGSSYKINLYPAPVQRFIVDHLCDILSYRKKRS